MRIESLTLLLHNMSLHLMEIYKIIVLSLTAEVQHYLKDFTYVSGVLFVVQSMSVNHGGFSLPCSVANGDPCFLIREVGTLHFPVLADTQISYIVVLPPNK